MEKQKHFCLNCLYYSAYYTKGVCCFIKLDFGNCSRNQEKICDKHGICDSWHSKYKIHKRRVSLAMKAVVDAAESLAVLKQIFEEEMKEE